MNFNFPYDTPYDIQLQVMEAIHSAIENKSIAFVESPTGTGKTLSLLCASLTWLQGSQFTHQTQEESDPNEPEWLRKFRSSSSHSAVDTPIPPPKRTKIRPSNDSLSIDDKIAQLIGSLDSESDKEEMPTIQSRPIRTPKIYYCSRTHSQLAQVMSELRKTSFFKPQKPLQLATSVASRSHLCINPKVSSLASNTAISQACQDLLESESGCPYYNPAKAFQQHLDTLEARHIADIEDLLSAGRDHSCCPYFSSRHLLPSANLVAVPYNAILHASTRASLGIDLNDNIVIFDEAHNMIDFVKQLRSVTISDPQSAFDYIHQSITTYLDRYYTRLSGANVSALSQLKSFFSCLSKFVRTSKPGVFPLNEFIHRAGIDAMNFSQLSRHIEETRLFIKVFAKDSTVDFYAITSLLQALESSSHEGKILLSASELKFVCLDAREAFSDIFSQCRSVIFCGGTMSPLSDTISQLIPTSFASRVVSKKVGHLVPSENVVLAITSKSMNGVPFNFSFESRNDAKMISDLGMVISNYARIIPDGLVCFFASFAYLDQVVQAWRSLTIFNTLNSIKQVFIEGRNESAESLLSEYEKVIQSGKGAIMFAVMNGKLSEGINFSDRLGRGVIVVGLPYPNIHEPEVKENIDSYIQLRLQSDPTAERQRLQSEYLENACMRVINQSIGRAIRHKDDYATMILIDERFRRDSIISKLPEWLSSSLRPATDTFSTSFQAISAQNAKLPRRPLPMLRPLSRTVLNRQQHFRPATTPFKRFSHSEGPGLHFENHRPEDAMPFNYDNKFTFALKLGLFSAVGLGIPIFGVWWNM